MRGPKRTFSHACTGQENALYSKCGIQGLWEGFALVRAVDSILCVAKTAQNATHEGGEDIATTSRSATPRGEWRGPARSRKEDHGKQKTSK
jgi:hypothetical protein